MPIRAVRRLREFSKDLANHNVTVRDATGLALAEFCRLGRFAWVNLPSLETKQHFQVVEASALQIRWS